MHATHSLASQMLTEDETHVFSGSKIVGLRFSFLVLDFLCVVACDEDGAAVLQVLFNRRKVDLFGFLNRDVLASVVVQEQHLV
jgi:hypothetical protein